MLSVLFTWIRMHIRTEGGQDLLEYALLGGMIALAILGAVVLFGGALTSMATGIGNCIDFTDTTVCDPGP